MARKYTVASMFAGVGGIDLAFIQSGFKIVWANEIDKYACRTYRLNFGEDSIVEGDIQDVSTDSIPDFDVLVAGFPCQAFSSVGLLKGFEDPRGNLFFETARVIAAKRPQVVFFENVANLVKHDKGNTFDTICRTLKELGYYYTYKIMNASDYGIPQQRNRIYMIASTSESLVDSFEFPTERPLKTDAFAFFDKERQPENYYMDKHRKWDEMMSFMDDRHRIYRFTDWGLSRGRDGICPTLLAAMGSPYERIPFFYDDYSVRKITQIEAARLQGFPDTFIWPIKKTPKQVYKQIGNSVCVPIVKEIADNIKKAMRKDKKNV
jgi:DNA (cytosine-5)-methyltransferase 1